MAKKKQKRSASGLRWVTVFTALFFFTSQFSAYAEINPNEISAARSAQASVPAETAKVPAEDPAKPPVDPTFTFLENETSLVPVKTEPVKETAPATAAEPPQPKPALFDQVLAALDQAKGFAAAAVEKLSESHLAQLAKQAWEFGIAVVRGITLLFTSHEEHALSVTQDFRKILDSDADILIHKQSAGETDPSGTDFLGASARGKKEYVFSKGQEDRIESAGYDGGGNVERLDGAALVRVMENFADPSYVSYQTVSTEAAEMQTEDRSLLDFYRSDPPPEITPDPSNPASTLLPKTAAGTYPSLTAVSRPKNPDGTIDWSDVSADLQSKTAAALAFNLYNQTSWGWGELNTGSLDLSSQFAGGLVLGLSSPDLSQVILEVTDAAGQKSRVLLKGITSDHQKWRILLSQFSGVDLTQISKIAIGLEGRFVGKHLNIEWGNFNYVPPVQNTLSNPPLTLLPLDSLGQRPAIQFTSSPLASDGSKDWSDGSAVMNAPDDFIVSQDLYNKTSWGRAYWSYDNAFTAQKETINLNTAFPGGMVFDVDSSNVTGLYFEVKDADGNSDRVLLSGITNQLQRYQIAASLFDDVDLTRIVEMGFVLEGRNPGKSYHVGWGNFDYSAPVGPAASGTALTPLPATSTGKKPLIAAPVSSVNTDGSRDWSDAFLNPLSGNSALVTFNQYNKTSWSRTEVRYDDPATPEQESLDLNTAFPSGIAFALTDNSTGVPEMFFEVTDANGIKESVKLTGVSGIRNVYKIPLDLFSQADLSKIISMGIVVRGKHVGQSLTLDWGGFAQAGEITGSEYSESALTVLNNNASLTAAGGNLDSTLPSASIDLEQNSSSEFQFVFDRRADAASSASVTAANGAFDNNDEFIGTPAALPDTLVLAARGSEGAKVRVTVMDVNKRQAVFILDLRPVYQNYALPLTGGGVPAGFNRNKIASITFAEDGKTGSLLQNDLVKIKMPGLRYDAPQVPAESAAVKDMLLTKGLTYFTTAKGIDPVTHFPFDSVEADGHPLTSDDPKKDANFTQPTLIGYYLQILGDVVSGKLSNGMTQDQALAEIDTVMTSLLSAQSSFGWKGLLPWMELKPSLQPRTNEIAVGDNANLAQSLAAMSGAIQTAQLTQAQSDAASALASKVEQFLNNQEPGYSALVDPVSGAFYSVFIRDSMTSVTGHYPNLYIDRVANEFRGAIAFLAVRYPSLPATVWEALGLKYNNYTDRNGHVIKNLAYFDGGAFQAFWPLLRNNETDFIGFRNALENAFVSYADYSVQNSLPGFVSASQRPDTDVSGIYAPKSGIRQIAESGNSDADKFIQDVGSVYALASAYSLEPSVVLNWLAQIRAQIPGLEGNEGFYDAARSDTEIAKRTIGIDEASILLGLSGAGPSDFAAYLRLHHQELAYNLLYDSLSKQIAIDQTAQTPPGPPVFPDRSVAVFSHLASQGTLNSFPGALASEAGVHPIYGNLSAFGGWGGYFWNLDQNYDVRSNQVVINYYSSDTPRKIKIELKDANDNLLWTLVPTITDTQTDKKIIFSLPSDASLSAVQKVILVVDQNNTGDRSGDFVIHSIDFFQYPS